MEAFQCVLNKHFRNCILLLTACRLGLYFWVKDNIYYNNKQKKISDSVRKDTIKDFKKRQLRK